MREQLLNVPDRGFRPFTSRIKEVCWVSSLFLCIFYLSVYILICYLFNFPSVKTSSVGRNAGSKRDDITYTSRHSRPTPFPDSSPTHLREGRLGEDPGNEIAHSSCI